jgi:hypothetical protein
MGNRWQFIPKNARLKVQFGRPPEKFWTEGLLRTPS